MTKDNLELISALLELADINFSIGRKRESLVHFRRAMELGADAARCMMGMGVSAMDSGEAMQAHGIFRAIKNDPEMPADVRCFAAINAGVVLIKLGMAKESLATLGEALDLFGDETGVKKTVMGGISYLASPYLIHHTMGTAHEVLSDFRSACDSFELALENERSGVENGLNTAQSRTELAYCRIRMGMMDHRSWELHESRWDTGRVALTKVLDPPISFGDPSGKTVMVYSEQGYGDSLQFSRFVRGIKALGAKKVVLVTHPPLARVFSALEGVDELAVSGEAHSKYDLHLPMMSLPHALRLGGHIQDYSGAYIKVKEEHSAVCRARLPAGFKIGVVWAGDPKLVHAEQVQRELEKRNVPLAMLMGEIERASSGFDISVVSLQKEDRRGELPRHPKVVNLMGEVADYYDTASIISCLDLVISVDTSVAHLAGAMGKPVWMLSRHMGCWRWGDAEHCLAKKWYPTMEIYRETEYNNWAPAVRKLGDDLKLLLGDVFS